jgi:heme oxygenase (mycobilin-producing)
MSTGHVRVLLFLATDDLAGLTEAYQKVSAELAGTPGLVGNELMRSVHRSDGYLVASEWESLAAFTKWEQGAAHRAQTAPVRPYQDPDMAVPYGVYEVTASW